MNTEQARIDAVETALYRWLKARELVKSEPTCTTIDQRDTQRRLMDLDNAIFELEQVAQSETAFATLKAAGLAMMGPR